MDSLEHSRVPSAHPVAAREIPLIDRVEEMNVLKETVYRAAHGEGGLVFIHGEAGIGKTRLVRELGAYARSRGVRVLYGRCPALFRMDGVPPYIIWKEIIRDYLAECSPEQLQRVIGWYPSEVAKLVPEIGQKLRAIPQSFSISPEQEQNRLFEAVSQFIVNISHETPLLVILDDLQWTDPSSLMLMHYLARDVQRSPLLILGAYRSTDIDAKHPLIPVLTELNRERLPESIQLKRMSLEDISEMVKGILEQEYVPAEFCKLVYEKTKGNPFFAEEVVRSLREDEVIFREDKKWSFKNVSKIEFPETVKNVLKTRFDKLNDECQNLLTLASFVGNDFTLEEMCAITGIEETRLLELTEELFKTGLIKERVVRGEGICSFSDVLVRDVIYEEVSPLKRKKLHGVVGCALEKVLAKDADEHFGELASHFLESGSKDKALDYYLKAGEKAARIQANEEASSYYESALELLKDRENAIQQKGQVLERLGDIKTLVGDYDSGIKHWNDKLALLECEHDEKSGQETARLHRKIANILWEEIGNQEKAVEHQNKALKILETEPESAELARLYADMAHMYWRSGDAGKARLWAEKALEFAKRLNDAELMATSCLELGATYGMAGESKKGLEFMETALEIALNNNYLGTAARAYNNIPTVLPPEQTERAIQCLEKAYEMAKKVGEINVLVFAASNLAGNLAGAGELDKALPLSKEAVALDRKTGNRNHLTVSLGELGNEYLILGEWDESEKCLKEAFNIAQALKDYQAVGYAYGMLAIFHYTKKEYAKAVEVGEKGYEFVKNTGDKMLQWWYSYYNTECHLELVDIEGVPTRIDELYRYALDVEARTENKQLIAYIERLRAKLLRTQKKWEESIEYYEKSLKDFEALGAKKWNVYEYARLVLCDYAQVYLDRDQKGDREKASTLLNQALDIFQKIGAKKGIERVEAEMVYIETGQKVSEPEQIEHVPTGNSDIDTLLNGGIPSNYTTVLTSPPCNERDMLLKSFLETGARNGEITFYVTVNPGIAKTLATGFESTFHLFICNPQADAIVRDSPHTFKLKGIENLTDLSIALTSAIRKLEPAQKMQRRACIDLVSDILLQHHAVQTRKWLTSLTAELKSVNFTMLAVVDPRMHPPEELHAILGLFEGEINVYEKETEKGPERFLRVRRMGNQKHLENEIILKRADL